MAVEHNALANTVNMHGIVFKTVADAATLAAETISATALAQRYVWLQTDTRQLWVPKSTTAGDFEPLILLGGAPANLAASAAPGTATTVSRTDHVHLMPRLDQVLAPTASVAFNSQKATGLLAGAASGEAVHFGQTAVAASSAGLQTAKNAARQSGPRFYVEMTDDWTTGALTGKYNWTSFASGAGAAATLVTTGQTNTHPGIVQVATGTTATGRATLLPPSNSLAFIAGSAGDLSIEWLAQIPTLSTTGVQQFIAITGLLQTTAAGDQTDAVYFEYDAATDTHWRVCTASGGTRTKQNTTVTVTAGQWYRLRAFKADGSTTWGFEIDGVDTGLTSSTNLPTIALIPGIKIDSSVGTTSKTMLADWMDLLDYFPTPRAA